MSVVINKRLLDVKGAADYLSISRSKLYQGIESGRIRSVRIDSKRLFDVQYLDAFVEQLKQQQNRPSVVNAQRSEIMDCVKTANVVYSRDNRAFWLLRIERRS